MARHISRLDMRPNPASVIQALLGVLHYVINQCGIKRTFCNDKARMNCLVFVPAQDHQEYDILSKPYYPDWRDDEDRADYLLSKDGDEEAAEMLGQ